MILIVLVGFVQSFFVFLFGLVGACTILYGPLCSSMVLHAIFGSNIWFLWPCMIFWSCMENIVLNVHCGPEWACIVPVWPCMGLDNLIWSCVE